MFAELAYFNTNGTAAGASVATGACVAAAGASVATGAGAPHALKSTDNVTRTESNTDYLFIFFSPLLVIGILVPYYHGWFAKSLQNFNVSKL
jgi:hypothetical protein